MLEIPQCIQERILANSGLLTADEVTQWPVGLFDKLVAAGVLRSEHPATSVACDACGDDHVELVEYVKSPAGTPLRAYIPCPDVGRVFVSMDRLRQWSIDMDALMRQGRHVVPTLKNRRSETRGGNDKPAKRAGSIEPKSWTQPELDAAIREYKAKRAPRYRDLVEGVQSGLSGAKKSAQAMFGRNTIARELGVKARAMVSKSLEWQAIARELRLSHGKDRNVKKKNKIGLDIAIEMQVSSKSESAAEVAMRNETTRLIRSALSEDEAASLLEKLEQGDVTEDQVLAIIELAKQQKRDRRSRKIRGGP